LIDHFLFFFFFFFFSSLRFNRENSKDLREMSVASEIEEDPNAPFESSSFSVEKCSY